MPKYLLIMRGTDESNAAMMANIEEGIARSRGSTNDRQGRGRAREQRPELMSTVDVEAVWRIESARIVAALTRFTGDFGLAEDAAQEAVAEALVSWPLAAPANPAGWLMATARRRAIDAIRRRTALQDRYALLAADPALDAEIDPDKIDDDVLALMFISCHPGLS